VFKNFILILFLILLVIPNISYGAVKVPGLPLVQCGRSQDDPSTDIKEDNPCTRCDLFRLLKNLIDLITYGVMPPVAVLFFIWAGLLILLGGANPSLVAQGKNIFTTTIYGILIMLSAWLITNTLIKSVGARYDNANNWWQFTCIQTGGQTSNQPPSDQPPSDQPPSDQPPSDTVATCVYDSVNPPMNNLTNLCQPRQMTCNASACRQYVSAINQYASRTGLPNGANFLKAIMMKESACRIEAQSSSVPPSCGLMQLQASTANIYKSRCGITADITCDWLKNSANADASICIAAEYIRALTQTSCGNTPRGVAAGYNGGSGACNNSIDCAGETSCSGEPVKRWECWYDNRQHTICNTGYNETRDYVTKVLYCYNNP
jgi:hypothetical protein